LKTNHPIEHEDEEDDENKSVVQGKPLPLFRMHWDHELTPNPSQEGNGQDANERVLPSWEGSGVGWFMESPTTFVPCIGTMPPRTAPRRGTDRMRTNACSPPGQR